MAQQRREGREEESAVLFRWAAIGVVADIIWKSKGKREGLRTAKEPPFWRVLRLIVCGVMDVGFHFADQAKDEQHEDRQDDPKKPLAEADGGANGRGHE